MKRKKRIRVLISGLVQGVFFRDETKKKADEIGVFGYVKNLNNGKVEAVFEGNKEKLDKIISYCHNGPEAAIIDKVEIKEEKYKGEFREFKILR